MGLLNDKIMAGVILGIISNIPKQIIDFILYKLNFSDFFCWHTTAGVLISKEWIYNTHHGLIIGFFMDFFFAGVIGVSLIYFLRYLGEGEYLFSKGVGFSIIIWVTLCIMIVDQRLSMYHTLFDPWHAYHSFIDHTTHGIVATYLILKYAKSTVTPKDKKSPSD